MSGLASWEARSTGQARSRIRRKRLEAVAFFRRHHGPLAANRLWVDARLKKKISTMLLAPTEN
jgi:hypothetical protein